MRRIATLVAVSALLVGFHPVAGFTALRTVSAPLRGVTLDDVANVNSIVSSFKSMSNFPTARVVFDEFVNPDYYASPVAAIRPYANVMGELLDSFYVKRYSVASYKARVTDYLNKLGSQVDIWEVGNEVNGEWLGTTSDVVAKISDAYNQTKARGMRAALTLYYNPDCWSRASNEMFTWAQKNIPAAMKAGLDYVLVSYYEEDCNNYRPTTAQWGTVFDQVHTMFPNSQIGFGEIGAHPHDSVSYKQAYINRYYPMALSTPNYIGGYFWWYYYEDMLPAPNTLWTTLNQAMAQQPAPSPSPSPTPTSSPTPTASPTPTSSPTPTASPTPTSSPSPTPSPTPSPSPSPSPSALLSDDFSSYAPGPWVQGATYGNWKLQFDGYGSAGVEIGASAILTEAPKASTSSGETHSSLVTSTKSFGDIDMTVQLMTVTQLRTPTANAWETAWLLWDYGDNVHFYYLALKPNGWELGKEDPAYPGAQRFLATGSKQFPIGSWYTVRVRQIAGTTTVWVNGTQIVTFTDKERPYTTGGVGLYNEDAHAHFDSVTVTQP